MKKRLYKIEQGKKLDGVCGGIAEYFDIDPTLKSFNTKRGMGCCKRCT